MNIEKFVDEIKLKKLSKLARVEIREQDFAKYLNLMNDDLELLRDLDKINVDGLKPLVNTVEISLREYPDVVTDGDKTEELMECAPHELHNYFVIPKIIEK